MTPGPLTSQQRRLSRGQHHRLDAAIGKKGKDGEALDIGKPLGEFDTASVREKVRKWQTQGGGVVSAEDGSIAAGDGGHELDTRSPKGRQSNKKYDHDSNEGAGSDKLSPRYVGMETSRENGNLDDKKRTQPSPRARHTRLDQDVKDASAPKKRVVSDSRWRKQQESPKVNVPSTPKYPDLSRPSRDTERSFSSKGASRSRGRSQSINRQTRTADKGYESKEDVAGRSTANRKTSNSLDATNRRRHRRRSSAGAGDNLSQDKNVKRGTPSPTRAYATRRSPKSPKNKRHGRGVSSHGGEQYMMSGALNFTSTSGMSSPESPDLARKPEEGASLGKSYKLPDRVETPPKVPGNRIEAWLTSTPDPFTEPNDLVVDSARPEIGIRGDTQNTARRREKSTNQNSANTHNKSDRVNVSNRPPINNDGNRRRRRSSSQKVDGGIERRTESHKVRSPDKDDESPTPSPSALKRRGARRKMQQQDTPKSPTQSESVREPSYETETAVSTAIQSLSDNSTEVPEMSMDDLMMRKPFPTTGKRLSTIVSVATQNTKAQAQSPSFVPEDSQATERPHRKPVADAARKPEQKSSSTHKSGLKRKLTTHADLMSVLSLPREESGSLVSARSIRTNRTRLATATVEDLMKEVASDETKYMRELRTLVDGVIPVLLSCVLSKSESATAAGLFSRSSSSSGASVTRPIVDMGVALERLRSTHKRIPLDSSDRFLAWAQTTLKIYSDYIKAWRLGFQDVVVNLAPATDIGEQKGGTWEDGLSRNEDGYLIDGDGERVDVAFLLKRPLVRLKYLAKTLKGIKAIKPSETAERLSCGYQDLVVEARKKSNQEKARLEDEAAASIDPSRARDPRTLAALPDVSIHPKRYVRARDYFDLHFPHSSGQLLDCKIEILLRDNLPSEREGGDALFCEVSSSGRWLLFPPVMLENVSAKLCSGGLTVQVRGRHSNGKEWNEVFNLHCDDREACSEWVEMLGSVPLPPDCPVASKFESKSSATTVSASETAVSSAFSGTKVSSATTESVPPSPRVVDIPIGEQIRKSDNTKPSGPSRDERRRSSPLSTSTTPKPYDEPPPRMKRKSVQIVEPAIDIPQNSKAKDSWWSLSSKLFGNSKGERNANSKEGNNRYHEPERLRKDRSRQQSYDGSPATPLSDDEVYYKESYKLRDREMPSPSSSRTAKSQPTTPSPLSRPGMTQRGYSVWLPSGTESFNDKHDENSDEDEECATSPKRPSPEAPTSHPPMHRRASSVPSEELPSIPRVRKPAKATNTLTKEPPSTPKLSPYSPPISSPLSAPAKLQKKTPDQTPTSVGNQSEKPPAPPAHKSPPNSYKKSPPSNLKLSPPQPGVRNSRRTSSPLKHEYEPSTATETSSESDVSDTDDETESSRSDDSDEDDLKSPKLQRPVMPEVKPTAQTKVSPPGSLFSMGKDTVSPSQSASQSPYRAVAPQPSQAKKTIASIFAWSEKGLWENLHPDECSIVITPGLIEAFEMTAQHSRTNTSQAEFNSPASNAPRPLIALELTPLVPIRRGTALDISIRSPPTANSRIKSGNNIMFRSRTAEECSALYYLINNSRINNPTYIALQNARAPYNDPAMASGLDRRNSMRGIRGSAGNGSTTGSGWWASHFGSSSRSYRASTRAPSVQTDSSVGTMATAFSALKRFSGPGRLFNIAHSTVSSARLYSSSSSLEGSSSSGNRTPPNGAAGQALSPAGPGSRQAMEMTGAGIANTKIRLYQRESQSKWRDMGSARLTITNPVRPGSINGNGAAAGGAPARQEKRIVATGKTKGEVLLDVTLGESCFERVARTGIAVSVWEEIVGPNGEIGQIGPVGGVGARARVYMIQVWELSLSLPFRPIFFPSW